MAGGAALALSSLAPAAPAPSQQQLQQAVAMNAFRLKAIGDRIKGHFRGGPTALQPSHLNDLIFAFARGIDYALSGGDIPKIAAEIPDTMRKVYQLRNDPFLQSSVMVLIISCKNACKNKWFQAADYIDILRMSDEISGNFCTPGSEPANDSTVLETISTVMPRYYPKLKFDRLVTSLEAKVGYDILMADFFIRRDLPKNEKISLIVVQKENLDVSSCIASPPQVSFLVNGKGVDKRNNVSMETGPQFPTDITKMLKYGANILQAVGYFNVNYTSGRGRGYNRGGLSRGRGRGYTSGPRANMAVSGEESSSTAHDELKKEAKMTSDGGYGDFSFDKFAHLAYTDEG